MGKEPNPKEAKAEYNVDLIDSPMHGYYDAAIFAVAHSEFKALSSSEIKALMKQQHVIYDLKYMLDPALVDIRL